MTIQDLKEQGLIVYECISGSKAYGLDIATSDTDIKGVFVWPKSKFYGLNYIPQVADESNDTVYYELNRFVELLIKNNPNILELLATPNDKILYKHPLLERLTPSIFLSKKCKDTFGGYAFTQIRKARGLNKKIVNPMDKKKKSILDFCYVLKDQGAISFVQWLMENDFVQEKCGLVNIPHFKDVYGIYYDEQSKLGYKGVRRKEQATTVLLSSIPKKEQPIAHLHFNEDGYVKYCKDYKDYWSWVGKRNESRYQGTLSHGKNYDAKNMMHTFRLLDMAFEILTTKQIVVKRPNRLELLSIRNGEWEYEALINEANLKMEQIEMVAKNSTLPEEPNISLIENILIGLRTEFYNDSKFNI